MLTRLHVRGFKSLLDVEIEFGPFTCVAGSNGVGKSNLFDAIHFLHLLSSETIGEAVRGLRSTRGRSLDPASLFTALGDRRAEEMRFTADMIMPREVEDLVGETVKASTSAVRYEIAFRLDESSRPSRLELVHESLVPILPADARQAIGFPASEGFMNSCISGKPKGSFVSTDLTEDGPAIKLHGEFLSAGRHRTLPPKSPRTAVAGLADSLHPTVLAVQSEMQSWRTLMLEPSAMRAPSEYGRPGIVDDRGGNLPATLARLTGQEAKPGQTLAELVNRLSDLIDDVRGLELRDDPQTETYTVEARDAAGNLYPARSLSDGTLRFLVLATLALDPEMHGVLCLEEPENGIHPERIPAMAALLRDIAVDPEEPVGPDNPLTQVIVNTHSPPFFRGVGRDDLIYFEPMWVGPSGGNVSVAAYPEGSWRASRAAVPGAPKGTGKPAGANLIAPGRVRAFLGRRRVPAMARPSGEGVVTELRFTLLADGPGDRCLLGLLEWEFRERGLSFISQFADAGAVELARKPGDNRLGERVAAALRAFPCDLLFVHRDAEARPAEERFEEIEAGPFGKPGSRTRSPSSPSG